MSQRTWVVDPWSFARTGGRRDGTVVASSMPRLGVLLASNDASMSLAVVGSRDEGGQMFVDLSVQGTLMLTCQRCLEPVEHRVRQIARFQLWPESKDIPTEELADDTIDALPVGNELDLIQLAEEEVLLGLPLAPRHERCELPRMDDRADEASPFLRLKQAKPAQ